MKKTDILVMDGEAHTIEEWCIIKDISITGLRTRIVKGMDIVDALCIPTNKQCIRKKKPRTERNCVNCIYSIKVHVFGGGIWNACDYLGITGKCRPCEPGDECTVKKARRIRRRRNTA